MLWKTTALIVALSIGTSSAAAAEDVIPPPVPAKLQVDADQRAFIIAHATGTQNYICLPTANGVAWGFLGPQATLFSDEGEQEMTHFLSPNPVENGIARATWQHSRDTSTVWAVATQTSTDPNYVAPGAIPWLLLRVVGVQYGPAAGDKMTQTTFIQRVNTAGGIAPSTGCGEAGDIGKRALVPYTTDYVFYRKQ